MIAAEAELIAEDVTAEPAAESAERIGRAGESESVGARVLVHRRRRATEPERRRRGSGGTQTRLEPSRRRRADSSAPVRRGHRPFVTETMAELYLKQGFRAGGALRVYEQLSAASPADDRLADKVASLRAECGAGGARAGPPVARLLRALRGSPAGRARRRRGPALRRRLRAVRRRARRPPSADAVHRTLATAHAARTARTECSASTAAGAAAAASIDALFGHRPTGTDGGFGRVGARAGVRWIGAATRRRSSRAIRRVRRPASSRSTACSATAARAAAHVAGLLVRPVLLAERRRRHDVRRRRAPRRRSRRPASLPSAAQDDIEQFNSWLQGLKQR